MSACRTRSSPSAGWIVPSPSDRLQRALAIHGIEAKPLEADRTARVEAFEIDSAAAESRPFQGHKLKSFTGRWKEREEVVPKGALYVAPGPSLARLGFVLFEPESDDGLGTWDLIGVEEGPPRRFGALHFLGWVDR